MYNVCVFDVYMYDGVYMLMRVYMTCTRMMHVCGVEFRGQHCDLSPLPSLCVLGVELRSLSVRDKGLDTLGRLSCLGLLLL